MSNDKTLVFYWDTSIQTQYKHNEVVNEHYLDVVKTIADKHPDLFIMVSPKGYGGSEEYFDRMVAIDTKRFSQR